MPLCKNIVSESLVESPAVCIFTIQTTFIVRDTLLSLHHVLMAKIKYTFDSIYCRENYIVNILLGI